MFTEKDFEKYFDEMRVLIKEPLERYTDLVNELDDRSIRSKISAIMAEDMDAFEFMTEQIERFGKSQ